MEDSILFKNIEDLTLKRDRLLKKLRKKVDEFKSNASHYGKLKPTLKEVSRSRRALLHVLNKVKQGGISEEYKELIDTLLEFSLLVTVEEELEILQEIRQTLNTVMPSENELSFIDDEIMRVKSLKEELEEILTNN